MFVPSSSPVATKLRFAEYSSLQRDNVPSHETPSVPTDSPIPGRIEAIGVNIKWGPEGYTPQKVLSLSESTNGAHKKDTTETPNPRSSLRDAQKEKTRAAIFDTATDQTNSRKPVTKVVVLHYSIKHHRICWIWVSLSEDHNSLKNKWPLVDLSGRVHFILRLSITLL
jgi:hypothetical protein